jgi:alpha,alpha-trehalose phosphorylase
VEVTKGETTYTLADGESLEIAHHGEPITVTKERPVSRSNPPPPTHPVPSQPPGRAPRRRGIEADDASLRGAAVASPT